MGASGGEVTTLLESPSALWRRWVAWVTTGEAVGFLAPAIVGAFTTRLPAPAAAPLLLAAGAAEGALLGAAQARVLSGVLPGLPVARWVAVTSAATVAAYLIWMGTAALAGSGRSWPAAVVVVVVAAAGLAVLASLGTAQWTVLRRHLPAAVRWIGWTALAWLAGLAAFLLIATPLWQEGQPVWLVVLIGALAGLAMAAVVAAVSGVAVVRLITQGRRNEPGRR